MEQLLNANNQHKFQLDKSWHALQLQQPKIHIHKTIPFKSSTLTLSNNGQNNNKKQSVHSFLTNNLKNRNNNLRLSKYNMENKNK